MRPTSDGSDIFLEACGALHRMRTKSDGTCQKRHQAVAVLECGTSVASVLCRATMAGMEPVSSNMAKSTTMTVRIPPEVSDKLDVLARHTDRTKAYLAGEAIASYVEHNAWQVARIKASLDDARSGGPGVPHAAVEQWVKSWDTDNELSRPEVKP